MNKHALATVGILAGLALIPIGGVAAAASATTPEEVASSTSSPATATTTESTMSETSSPEASPSASSTSDAPQPSATSDDSTASPEVDTTPTAPQYTTVLWQITDGDWKKPQRYIGSTPGADLDLLDHLQKCGTDYQVDIYHGDPSPLWADGFLQYGHDGGYLAYELGFTPYEQLTTDDCAVVVPPTEEPSSNPTEMPTPSPTSPATSAPTIGPIVSPTSTAPATEPVAPSTSAAAGGTDASQTSTAVQRSQRTVPSDEPQSEALAFTGSDVGPWPLAGALLAVVLGGLLVLAGRAKLIQRAHRKERDR